MKITFADIVDFMQSENLYNKEGTARICSHPSIGAFAAVEWKGRDRAGNELAGDAYFFPEFVVEGDTPVVNNHMVLFSNSDHFNQFIDKAHSAMPSDWQQVEACLNQMKTAPTYRSVKRNLPLSRWAVSTCKEWFSNEGIYKDATGTAIQKFVDAINTHFKCEGHQFNFEWLTGQDIVNKYKSWDDVSNSCMTGSVRACQTELWGTNGKQCRLLVVKDGDGEIARCLCYRPTESLEFDMTDVPFGIGWYYGRFYCIKGESSQLSYERRITQAIAWAKQHGLEELRYNTKGCVPLIVTEFAPYIDRGHVFVQGFREGEKCIWTMEDEVGERGARWRAIENDQYGGGFGRSNTDGDTQCARCECDCWEESSSYVENVGHVCQHCFENGDYVCCVDDTYRSLEDTWPVRFSWRAESTDYAESERDTVRTWRNGTRIVCVHAVDAEEADCYAPEELTTELFSGARYFGDPSDLVKVAGTIKFVDGRIEFEEDEEGGFALEDETAIFVKNGKDVVCYSSLSSFSPGIDTKKTRFMENNKVVIENHAYSLQAVGHRNILVSIGTHVVLAHYNGTHGHTPVPEVGSRWNEKVPTINIMSSVFETVAGLSFYSIMPSNNYSTSWAASCNNGFVIYTGALPYSVERYIGGCVTDVGFGQVALTVGELANKPFTHLVCKQGLHIVIVLNNGIILGVLAHTAESDTRNRTFHTTSYSLPERINVMDQRDGVLALDRLLSGLEPIHRIQRSNPNFEPSLKTFLANYCIACNGA